MEILESVILHRYVHSVMKATGCSADPHATGCIIPAAEYKYLLLMIGNHELICNMRKIVYRIALIFVPDYKSENAMY